jgi:hypothetical protein
MLYQIRRYELIDYGHVPLIPRLFEVPLNDSFVCLG